MATLSLIQFLYLRNSIYELSNTASGWSGVNFNTYCAGVLLTGGYGSFGGTNTATRTFTLPQHSQISITASLYAIDSWDLERMVLEIDSQTKIDTRVICTDGLGIQLCGNPDWGEHIVKYESGWYNHTSSTIDFKVQSFLDQGYNDESLGWNVKIEYIFNDCFFLYSQSNYAGTEYKFCRFEPNQIQGEILDEIRSIKIPPNAMFILQGPNFNGGVLTSYTTNQPNLIEPFKFPKQLIIP